MVIMVGLADSAIRFYGNEQWFYVSIEAAQPKIDELAARWPGIVWDEARWFSHGERRGTDGDCEDWYLIVRIIKPE